MSILLRNIRKLNFSNTIKYVSTETLRNHEKAEQRLEPCQSDSMLDIGTRNIFSEEHDIFRKSVRRFFQENIVPYHEQWESDGQISREAWLQAGKNGLLGITTPVENGGIGGDFLSSSIVLEEQCYSNCSGPGFALHSDIVMPYLTKYGSKEQIEKYIPKMVSGECISAIAMTEPGAGSDLQGIRTRAVKDGDDWILNGSKVFITNGYMCDMVIVVAVTDTKAKSVAKGISLFIVDSSMAGFKKGKKLKKLGVKAQDTSELFFEDVRLPKEALLGKENNGFFYLMGELPRERTLITILSQASSEFIFEETRSYVLGRKAFGKTLSNLQTVQHTLAELKSEIAVGRSFTDLCLSLQNQDTLDSSTASIGKYWVSEMLNRVATKCLQLHGGWGYMLEYPVCKAFADARLQPIYGGANEIMKELIARPIMAK